MTQPRDGAPGDDLDREPIDDEADEELEEAEDGEPQEIDDEDIEDDLVDESEADVDAEVDDYEAARREVAGEAPVAVPPPVRAGARGPDTRRRTATPARAPSPSEIAVHVREDWSRAFVLLTAAVYIGILLYGVFLGHGGVLTPIPTPSPEPTESASTSPGTSASPSAGASESASPSTSVTPSASASPTAAPSGSASPS